MTGPQRRITDHHHPEYWSKENQYRFEDRVTREIHGLREEVKGLAIRLTLMLGALAILGFLLPILAPFIRDWLNVSIPDAQAEGFMALWRAA